MSKDNTKDQEIVVIKMEGVNQGAKEFKEVLANVGVVKGFGIPTEREQEVSGRLANAQKAFDKVFDQYNLSGEKRVFDDTGSNFKQFNDQVTKNFKELTESVTFQEISSKPNPELLTKVIKTYEAATTVYKELGTQINKENTDLTKKPSEEIIFDPKKNNKHQPEIKIISPLDLEKLSRQDSTPQMTRTGTQNVLNKISETPKRMRKFASNKLEAANTFTQAEAAGVSNTLKSAAIKKSGRRKVTSASRTLPNPEIQSENKKNISEKLKLGRGSSGIKKLKAVLSRTFSKQKFNNLNNSEVTLKQNADKNIEKSQKLTGTIIPKGFEQRQRSNAQSIVKPINQGFTNQNNSQNKSAKELENSAGTLDIASSTGRERSTTTSTSSLSSSNQSNLSTTKSQDNISTIKSMDGPRARSDARSEVVYRNPEVDKINANKPSISTNTPDTTDRGKFRAATTLDGLPKIFQDIPQNNQDTKSKDQSNAHSQDIRNKTPTFPPKALKDAKEAVKPLKNQMTNSTNSTGVRPSSTISDTNKHLQNNEPGVLGK